jgi:sec-independent protein translocase protein TatA
MQLENILLFSMPGGGEWVLILLVVVFLFGGKKIPELMRGIGQGVREFNDAKKTVKSQIEEGMKDKDRPAEGKS